MSGHKRKDISNTDSSNPPKRTCTPSASSSSVQTLQQQPSASSSAAPPLQPLATTSSGSLLPLLEFFVADKQWIAKAPRPLESAELQHRLASAFSQVRAPKGAEDLKKTLKELLVFGLVAHLPDPHLPDSTSTPSLAQYIVDFLNKLLSPFEEKHPKHSFSFLSMQEVVRTKLFFHFLAFFLHVNIYLFSSQSKAHLFKTEEATSSIGIVHHVDSFHGTSEYLALAEARTPPKFSMVKASLQTTSVATSVPVSEALPQIASAATNVPASETLSQITSAAKFREGDRVQQQRAANYNVTREDAIVALRKGW